jgi:transposase
MKKTDVRTLSPDAQAALRIRIVQAVLEGMRQTEAARVFGVPCETVCRLMQKHRKGGLPALRAQRRGRPPVSRLKGWQASSIVRSITDRYPEQLKLPFVLWTREAVQMLIMRRFKLKLSLWTIGRYLRQWGFTPQKPIRRAYEQNDREVPRWLKESYPQIKALARREKAEIHWGDETGMRSDHQAGTSWGPRGRTPVIPGTGKRFRTNMISSLTNRGRLAFKIFRGKFHAGIFLDFTQRLIRYRRRRIFLIVDSHPVHVSAAVTNWVKRHRQKMKLIFLPTYSPALNPDEMVNQDVKANAVGRKRPYNLEEMEQNIAQHLTQRQRHPEIVKRYFHNPSVVYAA